MTEKSKFKAVPMAEFIEKHWKEGDIFVNTVLDCGPDGLLVVVPRDLVEEKAHGEG